MLQWAAALCMLPNMHLTVEMLLAGSEEILAIMPCKRSCATKEEV